MQSIIEHSGGELHIKYSLLSFEKIINSKRYVQMSKSDLEAMEERAANDICL